MSKEFVHPGDEQRPVIKRVAPFTWKDEYLTEYPQVLKQVAKEFGVLYTTKAKAGEGYTISKSTLTVPEGKELVRLRSRRFSDAGEFWDAYNLQVHELLVSQTPVAAARLKRISVYRPFTLGLTNPGYPYVLASHEQAAFINRQPAEFLADKQFSFFAARDMARKGLMGPLFSNLVLRNSETDISQRYNERFSVVADSGVTGYTGSESENLAIDRSIFLSTDKHDTRRKVSRPGASRVFEIGNISRLKVHDLVGSTQIAVLGAGPAGIMVTRAMVELGIPQNNIRVIDASGAYGGIWKQKNVANGSKNNPFPFQYQGVDLAKAPGSGTTVVDFLNQLADESSFSTPLPDVIAAKVLEVQPYTLDHRVILDVKGRKQSIYAPIVINTLGTGKPIEPNRPGIMTTDTPESAGVRWQQIWTPEQAARYRDKRVILVGLGNSTAEMLTQIHAYNQQGYGIDYRILTHYPEEAVANPEKTIRNTEGEFRVFRDLSQPVLTAWEGDLPSARDAYFAALADKKIISDVTHWTSRDKYITVKTKNGNEQGYDFATQYTLIGYGHSADDLNKYGMTVTDSGAVAHDYDGEIQRPIKNSYFKRMYKGYYGLGAILKNDADPNAVVMPGMMHRMYDMLFGVMMRIAEVKS